MSPDKKFKTHLLYICSYFAITWAVFLVISSTITFFHLQLNHTLTVVENWIFDQGWEITSLVKIISFFIAMKFVAIRSTSRRPLRDFFIQFFNRPNKRLFALILFNVFFAILFFKPTSADRVTYEISKIFYSYLGSFVYIFLDVVYVLFLHAIYPIKNSHRNVLALLFVMISYYLNQEAFTHSKEMSLSLVFYTLLVLMVSFWNRVNWSNAAIFLSLFVCPLVTFLGVDFILGYEFSYLIPTQKNIAVVFTSLIFVSAIYIKYNQVEKSDMSTPT